MRITEEVTVYCEGQPWDDDLRQEVYLKVLEADEFAVISKAWLSRVYTNLKKNHVRDETRRRELREEKHDIIIDMLGTRDVAADPAECLEMEEEAERKYKDLSPLLRQTMLHLLYQTAEEIAQQEGTSVNVIYQRIHQAKRLLQDG